MQVLLAVALWFYGVSPLSVQAQDSGLAAQPQAEPAPITPAQGPYNSTAPELIFPQSTLPAGEPARSSQRQPSPMGPSLGAGLGYGPIRPGDIVEVQVFDSPEYNVRMPVSSSGDIAIPYAGLFHIEGMTSVEGAKAIEHLFLDRQILRDPHVIVTTQQFGYSVTVLGEVHTPGIYALAGRQRLIDILTEAGGVTDRAGHVIEIFGAGSMKDPTSLLWDPTLRENDNAEVQLKAGQTVLVSRCGVVYVGGSVGRPGAYPICDSQHTTISEVIAEAMGVRPSSWGQRTILLRTSVTGTRVMQQVKLEDTLRGKKPDIVMQPDDILFVPPSTWKAVGKTAVTAMVGFATQAYFYIH
ncbi:MAG TPA: polysaccharide biosynthesis/export family protein [Acidobacteriaceae bacterium]|nr:polysaccharide biosynthesis/export family protein [Acidobacteriaceae bacterium]